MRRTFRRSSGSSFLSPRRGFRPELIRLEDRTLLATVTWINPAGGDWDTPSNWSTGALPGPSDDVVIALSGVTVTHSSSVSDAVNSLTISSNQSALDISNGSPSAQPRPSPAASRSATGH